MQITPRPYQSAAVKASLEGLHSRSKRALVVMATGLGKTMTAALITKEYHAKKILFLAQNNYILKHALEEFQLVFDKKTKMAIYNGMSKDGVREADIVFSTWQTMGNDLENWPLEYFDLIIVDEAHHSEADTYKPVLKYFRGAKLGITATPDRADEADIRQIFGPELVNITLEEAIARGWLPRIEYHVITDESLDEDTLQQIASEIREGKKRFTMAEVNRRIFIKKRDVEITKIISSYNEKAIVFCNSIAHAERMTKSLDLSATFHSTTGNSQKDTWDKNQATLGHLKNGIIRRVCAVNAFNEGVDVPSVGLVAFCRVTGVLTVFRQQLGRGLRPGKDKLIVLDFVGNLERIQDVLTMMNKISDLHEEFASRADMERDGYVRQRFEVSGKGFEFTFSNKIVDLMEVLEHCKQKLYATLQEATEATQKIGIVSHSDYNKRYKVDPRLPSDPQQSYPESWKNWYIFLGKTQKDFYETWQQASEAVIKLGIKSREGYRMACKKHPRLPSSPFYAYHDFPSWPVFLGRRDSTDRYTYEQARCAVRRMGIRTNKEYLERKHEDESLPGDPESFYPKEWRGWPSFLGKTEKYSLQQASKAAQRLGIRTSGEYKKKRKFDTRLPNFPQGHKDFPGWAKFLGNPEKKLYRTWQQASKAAHNLGIRTFTDYKKKRKSDPLLPCVPQRYKDFPGWAKFLGKV